MSQAPAGLRNHYSLSPLRPLRPRGLHPLPHLQTGTGRSDLTAIAAEAAALVRGDLLRDTIDELVMRRVFGLKRPRKYDPLFLHFYQSIDRANTQVKKDPSFLWLKMHSYVKDAPAHF